MTPAAFRTLIWRHYRLHGRHDLPWRKTRDPYRILVSEVMLQQTQVERVVPFYRAFLKEFPTVKALASAPLGRVLTVWQGLGYNRRAKMLHDAAKKVVRDYGAKMPKDGETLMSLPGVGPYTARAVAAFSNNEDSIFIETNIRTAVVHHFFATKKTVADSDVYKILESAHSKGRAREWYSALMDYGASLKKKGVRVNAKSAGYVRQSAFAGSSREARGAILRALAERERTEAALLALLPAARQEQLAASLRKLVAEGLVEKRKAAYRLP